MLKMKPVILLYSLVIAMPLTSWAAESTTVSALPATTVPAQMTPQSIAVVAFTAGSTTAEQKLATAMRFAFSQKISREQRLKRMDNVAVDQTVSGLQLTWDTWPSDDDLLTLLEGLDQNLVILGNVKNRTLTVRLYGPDHKLRKQLNAEIPPTTDSPRETVEKLLTDLLNFRFYVRSVEADHSFPEREAFWKTARNMVPDGDFSAAPKDPTFAAAQWHIVLEAKDWAPKYVADSKMVQRLPQDQVAIIDRKLADMLVAADPPAKPPAPSTILTAPPDPNPTKPTNPYSLLMRLSKPIAEENGLACVSTWIPVQQGQHYRFSAAYHSSGPVVRVFIKGFAQDPDQYGSKQDPEAARREYYRAQVLPRYVNNGWDLMEMDFTPEVLEKFSTKRIEWVRLEFLIYMAPGNVYFDNATIKPLTPPPPTTIPGTK